MTLTIVTGECSVPESWTPWLESNLCFGRIIKKYFSFVSFCVLSTSAPCLPLVVAQALKLFCFSKAYIRQ